MTGYLLDTHIVLWLLTDKANLNKNIREDIDYFQHLYFVSVESLREIVILQSLKKIKFDDKLEKIITALEKRQVSILPIELKHIKTLERLPIQEKDGKQHNDPFDRMLIAQAIANKLIIISSDSKFPFYKSCGLKLLVNET